MNLNPSEISDLIKQRIENFKVATEWRTEGAIVSVEDGIVRLHGLDNAMQGEMIEFPGDLFGLALNLERDTVGAIVLGNYEQLKEGQIAKCTGKILEVPVSDNIIGRVVNALGVAIDGKGIIKTDKSYPIEKVAPGVITRLSVSEPVSTGIKVIDAIIPIGRGQRELIIGDRQTGKTAIAIDAILNQKGQNMICVYVSIGQKDSKLRKIQIRLEEGGAMEYTIIVSAGSSEPAPLSYIAPYTGISIAEYFMDQGKDVLIIYDDLSKHAVAYREISLLLRRPPGREAYPGDVFYLHSRLLERACRKNKEYGGGSITALPIIETQAGDVSAYIPTNVISITDGQIYLETDLFNAGIRPALNVGLSVSRVGSAAQTKAMKQVAGRLRLDLAQFRELEAFAQFGTELDKATQSQLNRGRRIVEILKQPQYQPLAVEKQVLLIFAAVNGFLDEVKVERIKEFETKFIQYIEGTHSDIIKSIREEKTISERTEKLLSEVTKEFITSFIS